MQQLIGVAFKFNIKKIYKNNKYFLKKHELYVQTNYNEVMNNMNNMTYKNIFFSFVK